MESYRLHPHIGSFPVCVDLYPKTVPIVDLLINKNGWEINKKRKFMSLILETIEHVMNENLGTQKIKSPTSDRSCT